MEHQSDARAFAASSTAAAPRMDIYATIHKALRAMMMDTLHAVGRIDVHDTAERAELLAQMQAAAPAPAFAAVLDTVQPYLSQRDWAKLGSALAPAQVPAWIVA